ncbi:MAG: 4-hydroxy-tetrahydrodipicolinate synthase [Deltaproteobacteria bacterium]|nr:4-hydroxy-tetrahydrodipicolinate synthase [Deltaproteobacteria bacterium]
MFEGCFTALVTPFKKGKVDEESLRKLVEFQIENGVDGLVPCGTTGESATLTHDEHNRVIDIVIETSDGRVPIIAGTGSNSTSETIMLTNYGEKAGATAALLISPYYNKPTQEGLFEHYKAVAKETSIPLILYNVPGRTAVNMSPEIVARLSEIENIIGIKEATGNLEQVSNVIEYSKDDFIVLSGDDFATYPMLAIGAKGVISVTSNIAPKDVSDMCRFFREGKFAEALKLHYKLQLLHRAMFVQTNPIPVKTALSMMEVMAEEFRLPLVSMADKDKAVIEITLKEYGLI